MSKEDILLDYEQLERNQLISKGLSGKRLYQVSTGLIQVLTHDGKAYKFVQYNERSWTCENVVTVSVWMGPRKY